MNENDFHVGSILRGYESVYVKASENSWWAYDLTEELTANDVQEFLDTDIPDADKLEVLYKPDPASVLEELPPGSVILGGDSEVAIKFEQEWSVSGSEAWYDSSAVLELLGSAFEVVRRGETD